ncbi:MAG: DUF4294 domain-containing protein [Chitinophagales bacterium]
MAKKLAIVLFFWWTIPTLQAQSEKDPIVLPKVILLGDTLPEIVLDPIEINATRLTKVNLQEWQMRYLRKVYPYALRTARLTKKINDDLKLCKTKRQQKRYLNECEKVLRGEFEDNLKNLTRKQGQFLIKLIHRETGQTVYDLLKEYRSGWKAFWWNFAGKFFQLNLKDKYEPQGEDKEIENYIARLEEIYQQDGTKYKIENEQFNTPIPGEKRPKQRSESE